MRYGLGWRPELGAGIVAHLDRIDVLEIMAEDFADATRAERKALRFLRDQVPLVVHGTSLGLASTEAVDRRRLDDIARVIEWLEPELWSEHLAFVRGGGAEVGHLAAPPRNEATLEGLARNVETAFRVTGSWPLLENVASLIEPPLSTFDEGAWLHAVLDATPCSLLLDLHNVFANSVNFSFSAVDVVASLPPARIGAVHLAGGRRVERGRILDDHLHGVPEEVFALLALVEAPFVILERDGNYPAIEVLLGELDRARSVASGAPASSPAGRAPSRRPQRRRDAAEPAGGTPAFHLLAALYTDSEFRARFLANPASEARRWGFDDTEAAQIASMNLDDLALAARGFESKRAAKARSPQARSRTVPRNTSPA
jgi:uncharacterized protein